MKRLSKILLIVFFFLVGTFEIKAADLITTLKQSHTIEVTQSWFSFNKSYNIYIDNHHVGKVEGLYLNLLGERLVLSDLNGHIYGYEQQIKRWYVHLNRLAQVYNHENETVGFIGEEMIQNYFRWVKPFIFMILIIKRLPFLKKTCLSF